MTVKEVTATDSKNQRIAGTVEVIDKKTSTDTGRRLQDENPS